MAITSNTGTGNGSNKLFSFTFPYLETSDIDVYLNGALQTITTQYFFANATTVEFVTAPGNGVTVLIKRSTDEATISNSFFPGSSIKAADLNDNFNQVLFLAQETNNNVANAVAGQIPDGTITSAKIADGAIVDVDVSATAGIVATKLAFTQSGTGAAARTIDSKLKDVVSVKDFGAVGNGVANDTTAIQAAVTAVCGANKTLFFPVGTYLVSAPIVFPNNSFIVRGDSPTGTVIKAFNPAASTDLFQINGTGPAKVIENIGFNGPAFGAYGLGAGINVNGNGVLLNNVWFQGLLYGLKATGSFINCNFCVAEYCFIATEVTAALDESIWYGWTMYKNETDFSIAGTQKSFIIRDSNAIGTKTTVLECLASGLVFDGLLVQNDGTAHTPTIVNILGGYNLISSIKIYNFGATGVFFQGGSAVKNRVSNLIIEGVPTAIFASVGGNNTVSNFTLKGATTYGIRVDTAAGNQFNNFRIETCNYGIYLFASEGSSFSNGTVATSTTADWYYPTNNITETFIDNVSANFSALSTMTYLSTYISSGNKQTMVTAVPSTTTWKQGDIAINRVPVVGSPKAWRCTVAGTPGTWVSEGNL